MSRVITVVQHEMTLKSQPSVASLCQRLRSATHDAILFDHIEGRTVSETLPGENHRISFERSVNGSESIVLQKGLDEIFCPLLYEFWQAGSPESFLTADHRIRKTLADGGPFDVAFFYSQDGKLLSTPLQDELQSSALKFMMLVAPLPLFGVSNRQRLNFSKTKRPILRIPTILIEGSHGPVRPLVLLGKDLLSQDQTTMIGKTGDHTVAKSGGKWLQEKVVEAISSK